jgi:hypothetical protein
MATKLLRRNSNQKMSAAIVRTAKQNCLEAALEAGLEENKLSGHKFEAGQTVSVWDAQIDVDLLGQDNTPTGTMAAEYKNSPSAHRAQQFAAVAE